MKYFFLILVVMLPLSGFAQGIVPCGFDVNGDGFVKDPTPNLPIDNPSVEECRWEHFLIGINNVINFLIMITGSVAAIMFAYAGILVLTAGGANESKISKAKEISWSVVKGLALMLAAWLLVKMVLAGLGLKAGFSLLE